MLKYYFFTLTTLFSLLVYFTLHLFNFSSNNIANLIIINNSSSECNPFRFHKQYSVRFDNITYPKSLPLYLNGSINFECLNKKSITKKILFWNPFFGDNKFGFGIGRFEPFLKNNCPVVNCEVTNNRSKLNESDLILVHMRDNYDNLAQLNKNRTIKQRWVFVLYESPIHSKEFSDLNNFFNLTSTYKLNSDFPTFYESNSCMKWEFNSSFNDSFDFSKNKSQFSFAVISNCHDLSGRLKFINQIQKYISVDVYGRCGKKCQEDCKETFSKAYKFYFAFENGICKDYITEKFFGILKYPIIPVVLGGGKYDNFVPKSGYIDVNDFKSPKDLADYLIYLDKNSTAYNSYFKWKKHVQFYSNFLYFAPICEMCIKLHLEDFYGIKHSVINDFKTYWNRKKDCVFN